MPCFQATVKSFFFCIKTNMLEMSMVLYNSLIKVLFWCLIIIQHLICQNQTYLQRLQFGKILICFAKTCIKRSILDLEVYFLKYDLCEKTKTKIGIILIYFAETCIKRHKMAYLSTLVQSGA